MTHRIHIFGAAGSGTSTLGSHLAREIGGCHLDADSYYWHKSEPPFNRWMEGLACPVMRMDSNRPTEDLCNTILNQLVS